MPHRPAGRSFGDKRNKDTVWISGSWVNVRNAPRADAEVLAHSSSIPLYKLLRLKPKQAKNIARSNGTRAQALRTRSNSQGFVACRFLGKAPALDRNGRSTHIKTRLENIRNATQPAVFSPRAFWLQPSFARLNDTGDFFLSHHAFTKTKQLETIDANFVWEKRPPLKRFTIPEFEAHESTDGKWSDGCPKLAS